MEPRFAAALLGFALLTGPAMGQAGTADVHTGLVVSSGYVESKTIASGDSFPIWISFENRSDREIRNLHFVDFRTAGLKTDGRCWVPVNPSAPAGPSFPACIPDSRQPTVPTPLPDHLAAGQAVTVTGNLLRTSRAGEFMLTGMYAWTDVNGLEHRALIPVGPIEVTKDWEDWKSRVREDLPAVLKDVVLPVVKDLAWPLVGFFLGLLFKSGEQKRAALQQTWNQMLSTSHETAKGYYMPVSAAANWLITTFQPGSVNDPDEPFYYLALLFRRMRRLVDEISGFYLKDRVGERLVMECWDLIFDSFIGSFPGETGAGEKELLMSTISPNESLREYKQKISPVPSYTFPFPDRAKLLEVRKGFDRWTQRENFKKLDLAVLAVFYLVIDYEINRPYDPWYAEPQPFEIYKTLEQEKKLKSWLSNQPVKPNDSEKAQIEKVKTIYQLLKQHRRRNTGRKTPKGTKWMAGLWYSLRFRWQRWWPVS